MSECYTRISIPYIKVTLINYQKHSKKVTNWKIDIKSLLFHSLQGLSLLFFDKCDDIVNKNLQS